MPLVWLFPYYMQKQALLYTFGTHPFLASGQATLPVWALFVYSLLPIVRNTFTGLTSIPRSLDEAADAIGLSPLATAFMTNPG